MAEYHIKMRVNNSDRSYLHIRVIQPSVSDAEDYAKRQHPHGEVVSVERQAVESSNGPYFDD